MRVAWVMVLVACAHVPSGESALEQDAPVDQASVPPRPASPKKRPMPAGAILCDQNTPCPQGMRCVCYETVFDTDDPLEGVEHCEPMPDLSFRALALPGDAGTLRDLDKALDADAP